MRAFDAPATAFDRVATGVESQPASTSAAGGTVPRPPSSARRCGRNIAYINPEFAH
jgi:hypothetical protein